MVNGALSISMRMSLGAVALACILVGAGTGAIYAASKQCGSASWYALRSRTASGQMMNPNAMTAAHRTLPFGTKVRVVNQRNGRELVLTINDRGPFIKGRIIDVSRAAAVKLGFKNAGHVKVCIINV